MRLANACFFLNDTTKQLFEKNENKIPSWENSKIFKRPSVIPNSKFDELRKCEGFELRNQDKVHSRIYKIFLAYAMKST